MRNTFCVLFILLFFAQGYCQKAYKLRVEHSEAMKMEILKYADSMFLYDANLTYNLTTKHIYAYKFIEKEQMLQPDYLEIQMKLLEKSPDDAIVYNNIALYHQRKGDTLLAKEYYNKALANFKLLPKAKDSAFYFSFRSLIKFNLKQDGIEDIEKALSINKADSIAIAFYPMMLIGKGEFDKTKTILTEALQAKKDNYSAYLMLIVTDFYQTLMGVDFTTEEGKRKIEKMDIEKIIDLNVYDRYVDKDNKLFRQMKEMGGVFNAFVKFSLGFDTPWKPTGKDIAFIEAKEKYFKKLLSDKDANQYGVCITLGTLSLLQKKFVEAENYYHKALLVFPYEKESYDFNTIESYGNLACAYYKDRKKDKALEMVAKALEVKSLDKITRKSLLLNQAKLTAELGYFDKASDIVMEAKQLGEDFDVDFLLSYLYAKLDSPALAQRYLEKAQQRTSTEEDVCEMLTNMIVFYIANGYLDEAHVLFDENKKLFVNYKCEDCEKLLSKYLIVND